MQSLESKKNTSKFLLGGIFFILIFVDQITKIYAKNVFLNSNFAFSITLPKTVIYTIYFVVIGWLIYFFKKNFQELNFINRLAFILVLAGAFSNVIERLIFGHVRDFIFISLFNLTGVYNIADGYIILGIILFLCYGLTTKSNGIK